MIGKYSSTQYISVMEQLNGCHVIDADVNIGPEGKKVELDYEFTSTVLDLWAVDVDYD